MVVTRGEGAWRENEEGQGGQLYGDGGRLDLRVVSTQCNIQRLYYTVVHLKHIISLADVTPIHLKQQQKTNNTKRKLPELARHGKACFVPSGEARHATCTLVQPRQVGPCRATQSYPLFHQSAQIHKESFCTVLGPHEPESVLKQNLLLSRWPGRLLSSLKWLRWGSPCPLPLHSPSCRALLAEGPWPDSPDSVPAHEAEAHMIEEWRAGSQGPAASPPAPTEGSGLLVGEQGSGSLRPAR